MVIGSKAFVCPWFGRSNAAAKMQPQVPGVASLVVSAAQAKATCPRPKCKPMPLKKFCLGSESVLKEGPVVGELCAGAPGRGGMPVPGGCRLQSKNEDSHKDVNVDVRAPRRTERIASV